MSRKHWHFRDGDQLHDLARTCASEYQSGDPFPHIAIDDFFPNPDVLDRLAGEFPAASHPSWVAHESRNSCKKRGFNDVAAMESTTIELLLQLNAKPFVDFLEILTGLSGLVPDPHFEGGGLHETPAGGFLNVHVDFNRQRQLGLDRRLNALLFLNRNWRDDYGGQFELWDRTGERQVKTITPEFNRLVVFSTTETSYHGHPEPVRCPAGESRRSLALYFYTNGRPRDERAVPHLTRWAR